MQVEPAPAAVYKSGRFDHKRDGGPGRWAEQLCVLRDAGVWRLSGVEIYGAFSMLRSGYARLRRQYRRAVASEPSPSGERADEDLLRDVYSHGLWAGRGAL